MKKKQVGKGAKLFIEGSLTNRKWVDQKGNNRVTTEIILQGYSTNLLILPVAAKSNYQGDDLDFSHNSQENSNSFEKKTVNNNLANNHANEESLDDFDNFLNCSNFDDDEDKIPF